MRVGITGGSGFVGTYVVEAFIDAGHDVLVLDPNPPKQGPFAVEHVTGDIRDHAAVDAFVDQVDIVVHLAAVLGTSETIADTRPAIETNILGTLNAIGACGRAGNRPLVFATCGNTQMMNGYATTKRCAERLILQARAYNGLPAAVVRPLNAYGPGQTVHKPYGPGSVRKAMPSFVCGALSGNDLELYGGGDQLADTVWAGDIGAVFVATAQRVAAGEFIEYPVEIGCVDSHTARDLALAVRDQVVLIGGPYVELVDVPMRPGEMTAEEAVFTASQVEASVDALASLGVPLSLARQITKPLSNGVTADLTTLHQVGLDQSNLMPLQQGVAKTVAWYVENEGVTWNRVKF